MKTLNTSTKLAVLAVAFAICGHPAFGATERQNSATHPVAVQKTTPVQSESGSAESNPSSGILTDEQLLAIGQKKANAFAAQGDFEQANRIMEEARKFIQNRRTDGAVNNRSGKSVLGQGTHAGEMKTLTLPGGATMEMVWCPPGTFTMGSNNGPNDEKPPHKVTLTKGFWMAKTEVTQKQWKSVMGNNPSQWKGDDLPVENVSWDEAQDFCRKAGNGLQLPTEAQWEYACRAGSKTEYFWGDSLNGDRANCDGKYPYGTATKGPYEEKTTRVGSYAPNAWGLYDMHGNVWEWCADWYDEFYYAKSPGTNPSGPASGGNRVVRGGSWYIIALYCRSAIRLGCNPGFRRRDLGFRPVARQD